MTPERDEPKRLTTTVPAASSSAVSEAQMPGGNAMKAVVWLVIAFAAYKAVLFLVTGGSSVRCSDPIDCSNRSQAAMAGPSSVERLHEGAEYLLYSCHHYDDPGACSEAEQLRFTAQTIHGHSW